MASAHSKSHVFPIKIQSKTNAFSDASFRTSFFEGLVRLDAKTVDFGSPLASSWAQNAARNHPSGAKDGLRKLPVDYVAPTCFQDHFRNAPRHHFGWFWMDFECICMDFVIMLNACLKHCCNKIRRLPTPPDTKRIDSKHQEHTAICRNMQESTANKNADTKTPIDTLQFTECNQLQQAPIVKNGGRR